MKYHIGQNASFSKTISESDVYLFAGICGDFNGVHINKELAGKSIFGKRVVHGALVNSLISSVLGMKLPGEGTIYLFQSSRFIKPAFIGDTLTAKVEIIDIMNKKATLKTIVTNQDNELILEGEARVLLP